MGSPVGTDGIKPIRYPSDLWRIYELRQVWSGTIGEGKYVPNPRDYVVDADTYTTYIVDSVDYDTEIPTLREIRPNNMTYTFSKSDLLLGVGPGNNNEKYRLYIDTSTIPYEVTPDPRCYSSGTTYYKLFVGSLTDGTAKAISKVYDTSGKLVSDSVPLVLAALDNHTNYTVMVPTPCKTTTNLLDNELVTIVFYNKSGSVAQKSQLLVENTNFISSVNASIRYVSHISLESAFLSQTVKNQIEFPLNVPTNGLNMIGVVHYTDGSTMRLPVDGTRFAMLGLDQYVSSQEGQNIKLVLRYILGNGESAVGASDYGNKSVCEAYNILTVNSNMSYSVKLYGYPVFVNTNIGYNMRWFLCNMDRNTFADVTPYVTFNQSTGYFNTKAYGILQKKSVSINLRDVSSGYKPVIHTQVVDIVLNGDPGTVSNEWNVLHSSVIGGTPYGFNVSAKKISGTKVNIKSGFNDFQTWISNLYSLTYPLYIPVNEVDAPQPTHIVVMANGIEVEFPITKWGDDLDIGVDAPIYSTIFVKWIKRTVSVDLTLSVSALIIKP